MIWLWFLLGYLLVMFIIYIVCTYTAYRDIKLLDEIFNRE